MTALAVVQSAAIGSNQTTPNNMAVTFGAGPTQNNLLFAIVNSIIVTPVVGAGWTLSSSSSFTNWAAQTVYTFHMYKYAGAGESTTQTPNSASIGFGFVHVWEVSGVTGTFATDHVADKDATTGQGTNNASSETLGTDTTTNNNELGLFLGVAQSSLLSTLTPFAQSGGSATTDSAPTNANSGYDGIGFHQAFPTSGTTTPAYSINFTNANYTGYWAITRLKGGASATETSTGEMDFAGISFAGAAGRTETSTGVMSFVGISYTGAGAAGESATGGMAFAGISIVANGMDFVPGGGFTFSTFGA